jgi:hypothetical protein
LITKSRSDPGRTLSPTALGGGAVCSAGGGGGGAVGTGPVGFGREAQAAIEAAAVAISAKRKAVLTVVDFTKASPLSADSLDVGDQPGQSSQLPAVRN